MSGEPAARGVLRAVALRATPERRPNLEVVQVAADVYMIGGAGGNVTVHIGPQGLFVVDAGAGSVEREDWSPPFAGSRTSRFATLANTSADADHVGGNAVVESAGPGGPDAREQTRRALPSSRTRQSSTA